MIKYNSLKERLQKMSKEELDVALQLTAEGDKTYCAKQLNGVDDDRAETMLEAEAQWDMFFSTINDPSINNDSVLNGSDSVVALPVEWGNDSLCSLDDSISTPWKKSYPGLADGMTFSTSRLLQGGATGSIGIFPPVVKLDDTGVHLAFYQDHASNSCHAKIQGTDRPYAVEVVLLNGVSEIAHYSVTSSEACSISPEAILCSDRFLIIKK